MQLEKLGYQPKTNNRLEVEKLKSFHRKKPLPNGFKVVSVFSEKSYGFSVDGEFDIRPGFYPNGLNNGYPVDSNFKMIKGIDYLRMLPIWDSVDFWIKENGEHGTIAMFLKKEGYFPEEDEQQVMMILNRYYHSIPDQHLVLNSNQSVEFARVMKTVYDNVDALKVMEFTIAHQVNRVESSVKIEKKTGFPMRQTTTDITQLSKIAKDYAELKHDIKNGDYKSKWASIRMDKERLAIERLKQGSTKKNEDTSLVVKQEVENAQRLLIQKIESVDPSVHKVLQDKNSRDKIRRVLDHMRKVKNLDIVETKSIGYDKEASNDKDVIKF